MNNYLFFTEASKGEKATKEEIEQVKAFAQLAYKSAQNGLKKHNVKPQVDRAIARHGKDAVLKTGYTDPAHKKPIIIKLVDIDCFGDVYKDVPLIDYADGQYDFKGLTEASLKAYLMGHDFINVAGASGGAVLLISDGLTMEELAEKLVNQPRTYTLRPIRKISVEPVKEGVFYTEKNGVKNDDIAGEMLSEEKSIRQQLIDMGIVKTFPARMMTPEEIAALEEKESDT